MRTLDLHPARGLLHPAWLASLLLLALNDHVLKGAGLLPGVVTGKLSDVVGLVVAPLLLAALLRVRSMRAWVACHLAVGAVFSAIQLSAAAADGFTALMGLCGFSWVITRDPTDLLALPALAASAWGFLPVMRRPAAANARRSAEAGAAAVGLLCCAATSDVDEPLPPDWGDTDTDGFETDDGDEEPALPPISVDVYLSNATGQDAVVRIRAFRPEVAIDCAAVAEAPGALLRSSLFAPAVTWSLPPAANLSVRASYATSAPCYAAWIEGDALPPAILFWWDGTPPILSVPAFGQTGVAGEVMLVPGELGALALHSDFGLAFEADALDPDDEGECAMQPDAARLGWSSPVPWGPASLVSVTPGVDGCFALELAQGDQLPQPWYLCVPSSSFPFVAGDEVELRLPEGVDPSLDAVEIVTRGSDGEARMPMLLASAGPSLPSAYGIEMLAVPQHECALASEPTCGAVERPMSILVEGEDVGPAELQAGGEGLTYRDETRWLEIAVMHAQQRVVLDPVCSLGPDVLGPDLEVVIATWPR